MIKKDCEVVVQQAKINRTFLWKHHSRIAHPRQLLNSLVFTPLANHVNCISRLEPQHHTTEVPPEEDDQEGLRGCGPTSKNKPYFFVEASLKNCPSKTVIELISIHPTCQSRKLHFTS
ncbi:hypothetical protein QE152_g28503 [Popillia japonica]|uniref:Uncharacterized protein n=1 Tax=Popillia japonica TaxID=7064 RepID=A0AAW1JJ66_POPJA